MATLDLAIPFFDNKEWMYESDLAYEMPIRNTKVKNHEGYMIHIRAYIM